MQELKQLIEDVPGAEAYCYHATDSAGHGMDTAKIIADIEIGFHYYKDGNVDRQARGTLTNFNAWTAQEESGIDEALLEYGLKGNIGDRDQISFRGKEINIHEGQNKHGDFGSWRLFLWDGANGQSVPLEMRTHGGSQAFANPAYTLLPAPGGGQALVVTVFVPSENSAPGEAGELIYYKKID